MPALRRAVPLAGLLVALAVSWAHADETSAAQKKVAEANLQKAEVKKATVVETDNLIVCTPLPDARTQAVANLLQKTYKVARAGLQFEAKEEPWKGKLTVYFLPDRAEYNQFLRAITGQRPETAYFVDIRRDDPFVVSGADLPEKTPNADVAAELAPLVGHALLMSKAGATAPVPTWVRTGYGRAAALRAEGTGGKMFTTYKTQARLAVLGGKGKPPAPLADTWGTDRQDADLLATSLLDYMAFGPGKANFPRFVTGLRADENGDAPAIMGVLETVGWKAPELEAGWRKWVQGGMVVK